MDSFSFGLKRVGYQNHVVFPEQETIVLFKTKSKKMQRMLFSSYTIRIKYHLFSKPKYLKLILIFSQI